MKRLLYYLVLLLIAEIAASVAVWHGTPTDSVKGQLHFWSFELSRLQYGSILCLLAAVFWSAGTWFFASASLVVNLFGIVGALAGEIATSICFWKRLPLIQAGYLGWPNFRQYVFEHSVSWAVVLLIELTMGYWLNSQKGSQISSTSD